MDERKKSFTAIVILISFFIVLILAVGKIFLGKKVLSPVPDDGAIKIIFVTPTQNPVASPSASPSLTPVSTKKST